MELISSKSVQQFSIQTISTLHLCCTKSALLVAHDACYSVFCRETVKVKKKIDDPQNVICRK